VIRWRTASVGLAVVGLAISGYLSLVHALSRQVPLLCSTSGLVNCEQVTTSTQSFVGPLPVAYLGIAWFVVMLGILAAHGRCARAHWWGAFGLGWTALGTLFALYLIYAELFLIGAICLWCTAVHALVFTLFLAAVGTYETSLGETTTAS
jgi:uncharacterized membrane protein